MAGAIACSVSRLTPVTTSRPTAATAATRASRPMRSGEYSQRVATRPSPAAAQVAASATAKTPSRTTDVPRASPTPTVTVRKDASPMARTLIGAHDEAGVHVGAREGGKQRDRAGEAASVLGKDGHGGRPFVRHSRVTRSTLPEYPSRDRRRASRAVNLPFRRPGSPGSPRSPWP